MSQLAEVKISPSPSIDSLKAQYSDSVGRANRLRETMANQVSELLLQGQIALGVPLENRVKSWESIEEKLERKCLILPSIEALDDFVGLRLILLFRSDLLAVDKIIHTTFNVISSEDTAKRLSETQFGYQSQHYIVCLPSSWLAIPTMSDLGSLKVEIQVRTLAQHIWAAASHKLQYKHEDSVPPPLRRTIHRVSALLETVDLEFDRVLEERRNYNVTRPAGTTDSEILNVDLLASVLREMFPPANATGEEQFEELLVDLKSFSIETVAELRNMLKKHMVEIMSSDDKAVLKASANGYKGTTEERNKSGVFFTHVGLARQALREEFGKNIKIGKGRKMQEVKK